MIVSKIDEVIVTAWRDAVRLDWDNPYLIGSEEYERYEVEFEAIIEIILKRAKSYGKNY